MKSTPAYVIALHPCSRGFGWALFECADSIFDWGTADVREGDKNVEALRRADVLFKRHRPRLLALEAFDEPTSRRSPRIRKLCRSLIVRAEKRGISVCLCARGEIQALFACKTREDVAAAVAKQLPALASLLPRRRKVWESEPARLPLFSAAACALACYASERN